MSEALVVWRLVVLAGRGVWRSSRTWARASRSAGGDGGGVASEVPLAEVGRAARRTARCG